MLLYIVCGYTVIYIEKGRVGKPGPVKQPCSPESHRIIYQNAIEGFTIYVVWHHLSLHSGFYFVKVLGYLHIDIKKQLEIQFAQHILLLILQWREPLRPHSKTSCFGGPACTWLSHAVWITIMSCLFPSAPGIVRVALSHGKSSVLTCEMKDPCDLFIAEPCPPGPTPTCPVTFSRVSTGTPPLGVRCVISRTMREGVEEKCTGAFLDMNGTDGNWELTQALGILLHVSPAVF